MIPSLRHQLQTRSDAPPLAVMGGPKAPNFQFEQIKTRIHQQILEDMDLRRMDSLPAERLRQELQGLTESLIALRFRVAGEVRDVQRERGPEANHRGEPRAEDRQELGHRQRLGRSGQHHRQPAAGQGHALAGCQRRPRRGVRAGREGITCVIARPVRAAAIQSACAADLDCFAFGSQ